MVISDRAILFRCENCKKPQFHKDSLKIAWYEDRTVVQDHILCEFCGHDNHVIREL